MYDALIIGGGASGMSCALVLGSAMNKPFCEGKKVGIIMHQKASHLQDAKFYNALGLHPGTKGEDILSEGKNHLKEIYPEVDQIYSEKVLGIDFLEDEKMKVITNKSAYISKMVVIAVGYTNTLHITGLESYVIPHKKSKPSKNRIQLINNDHLIREGLYVAGTLAGWRSQFAIAAGSGASVATDILTLWNNGEHVKIHDKT
ncbi:MAG TPA: FAD-dependent oxidoreductase [Salinimicrobium sp.]|nr:FAD-dependent oxidoreductase [Salinimicrobium sp.]